MLVLHLALAVLELDELRSQDVERIEVWCCVVPGKAELRVVTDECGRRTLALVAVDADCVPVYQARQLHTTSLPASGSKAIVKGERECLSSAIRIFSMAQAGIGYEK